MLFSFSDYEQIACALQASAGFAKRSFTIARYDNHELHAIVPGSVSGETCFVLGSIAPPDEQMVSLLLLAHTLKQGGASQITGVLPYLAYTRQDKSKVGESLAAAWVGSLLKASGFDQILTIDVHSVRDSELFPVPLISLSTAKLFAATIQKHGLSEATIVAADNGAIARCKAVKKAAGLPSSSTPHFEKERTDKGIVHSRLIGEVGPRVVFVDDMLDTGGTLVSACEKLMDSKVEEIYVFVTHGLFTGTAWNRLWSLGVKQIFCTDTVQPLATGAREKNVTVLSVVPLLEEYLSSEGSACIALTDLKMS